MEVGSGGDEEVNVVERRVGLKRREDGFPCRVRRREVEDVGWYLPCVARRGHSLAGLQALPFEYRSSFQSNIPRCFVNSVHHKSNEM